MNNEQEVKIDKIVYGGQSLAKLDNGEKCFIWGAIPEEKVVVDIIDLKKNYCEGIAKRIIEKSKNRCEPKEPLSYLNTSPWQIMKYDYENSTKKDLINDAFLQNKVTLKSPINLFHSDKDYYYRNKAEFSFVQSVNEGVTLGEFKRGTKDKISVSGSSLAIDVINDAAKIILKAINDQDIKDFQLIKVAIRCTKLNDVSVQLYTHDKSLHINTDFPSNIKIFQLIYVHNNREQIIQKLNNNTYLEDTVLDKTFHYQPDGFFQINLPVYEAALTDMKQFTDENSDLIDFYSGVGTIGLSLEGRNIKLVEINHKAYAEAKFNIIKQARNNVQAICAPSEKCLDYIKEENIVIFDPPRSGIDKRIINKLNEVSPKKVIYLSCNPITQSRDIAYLLNYKISFQKGYNFFPKTPHIENLIVLDRK
jgi:23S rRNA (uracil1939-C5)-methyltransferase